MSNLKISFCTPCMNRFNQIQETVEHNLELLQRFRGRVDWNFVNFVKDAKGEVIDNWIQTYINEEGFNYYLSTELISWHASIAKNTAHVVSEGDYLINLDCDNFLDERGILAVLNLDNESLKKTIYTGYSGEVVLRNHFRWNKNLRKKYHFNNASGDGSYGRVGMSRQFFFDLGGYDQSLPPMGGQDKNLFRRAVIKYPDHILIHSPVQTKPIANTKEEGLINTDHAITDWKKLDKITYNSTKMALINNQLVVNKGMQLGVSVK